MIHYNSDDLLGAFDRNKAEFLYTYREHHALQEFSISNAPTSTQINTTMPDDDGAPQGTKTQPTKHSLLRTKILLGSF